jgi:hypothetical protein
MGSDLRRDTRGTTPVVSKTLAIGIVLLYIGGMTTLLYGSVLPEYRTATGEELAERTLAAAAGEIEQSVPEATGEINRTRRVSLPDRIREDRYRIELSGERLRLTHPDGEISPATTLSVPPGTALANSSWESGERLAIRATGPAHNRTVRID